ncbi:hypothetical protein E2C01_059655 [Portunus trituberculatus]|uniref:Uncharacterized protein n=1 Tax=Portunus trituberculatus TaxID=210409 RepID=A0A5B7H6T0_PORTR|nr:hypothetical protein [Portunus trituberculatus]
MSVTTTMSPVTTVITRCCLIACLGYTRFWGTVSRLQSITCRVPQETRTGWPAVLPRPSRPHCHTPWKNVQTLYTRYNFYYNLSLKIHEENTKFPLTSLLILKPITQESHRNALCSSSIHCFVGVLLMYSYVLLIPCSPNF